MEYVSRCPACSSLVRRGQEWCTLCHADLRPPEARPTARAVVATEAAEGIEPGEHPHADASPEAGVGDLDVAAVQELRALLLSDPPEPFTEQPAPAVGKHARAVEPETPTGVDPATMSELMARLAAESGEPLGGLLARLPESQGMRILLALGVGGTLAVLFVGICWLLGLVLG